jgi:hypothetical protein
LARQVVQVADGQKLVILEHIGFRIHHVAVFFFSFGIVIFIFTCIIRIIGSVPVFATLIWEILDCGGEWGCDT